MSKKTPAVAAIALLLLVALMLRSRSAPSRPYEAIADAGATSASEVPETFSTSGTREAHAEGVPGGPRRTRERSSAIAPLARSCATRSGAPSLSPHRRTNQRASTSRTCFRRRSPSAGRPRAHRAHVHPGSNAPGLLPDGEGLLRRSDGARPRREGRGRPPVAIVGDAKIGGVVESADVLDRSTLRDAEMIKCMRESMLTMTFPPPKQGGFVTVEYPLVFSNDDGG